MGTRAVDAADEALAVLMAARTVLMGVWLLRALLFRCVLMGSGTVLMDSRCVLMSSRTVHLFSSSAHRCAA